MYLPVLVFKRMVNYMLTVLLLTDKRFLIDTGNGDITLPYDLTDSLSEYEMSCVYFLRYMIHSYSS